MIKFWITLRSKNANKDEISNPPIGGIIPLNMFKYGSVMDVNADNIPLLQSIPGNHVNNILIIKMNEYIDKVWPKTPKISDNIIFL